MDNQAKMLEIWAKIFNQPVRPESDFFTDLDGDSMAAAAVAHWVALEFGVVLPMVEVFDRPNPAELTEVVEELLRDQQSTVDVS